MNDILQTKKYRDIQPNEVFMAFGRFWILEITNSEKGEFQKKLVIVRKIWKKTFRKTKISTTFFSNLCPKTKLVTAGWILGKKPNDTERPKTASEISMCA